jgi:hypothetical protein
VYETAAAWTSGWAQIGVPGVVGDVQPLVTRRSPTSPRVRPRRPDVWSPGLRRPKVRMRRRHAPTRHVPVRPHSRRAGRRRHPCSRCRPAGTRWSDLRVPMPAPVRGRRRRSRRCRRRRPVRLRGGAEAEQAGLRGRSCACRSAPATRRAHAERPCRPSLLDIPACVSQDVMTARCEADGVGLLTAGDEPDGGGGRQAEQGLQPGAAGLLCGDRGRRERRVERALVPPRSEHVRRGRCVNRPADHEPEVARACGGGQTGFGRRHEVLDDPVGRGRSAGQRPTEGLEQGIEVVAGGHRAVGQSGPVVSRMVGRATKKLADAGGGQSSPDLGPGRATLRPGEDFVNHPSIARSEEMIDSATPKEEAVSGRRTCAPGRETGYERCHHGRWCPPTRSAGPT